MSALVDYRASTEQLLLERACTPGGLSEAAEDAWIDILEAHWNAMTTEERLLVERELAHEAVPEAPCVLGLVDEVVQLGESGMHRRVG